MPFHMSMRSQPQFLPAAFCAALIFLQLFVPGRDAIAQDASSAAATTIIDNRLESIQFVGPFGAEGEREPKGDTFTFKDGKFATGSCLEWGFTPAPYWVRRDASGIHFLAELESPEHGTMRYEGIFDGEELTVVGYWRKERWYWTTERTYRGSGRPVQAAE